MSTPPPDEQAAAELADTQETKDDEVLEREGVETELMDADRSEVGERVEGVEDE
ncbi:MAG TPA: hypothetical protein VHH09_03045 [Acidimicrobiales bacterium]|nr:hypothetical protein [Acidimicrobiales bacterium]